MKVQAFLKDALWTLSTEESLVKAVMAEVKKNPEYYFSDLPGLLNRCISRVGKQFEVEDKLPWKQFLTDTQSIVKIKLLADPIGMYLKREWLLSSLPARMDSVAIAVVQFVRREPAQFCSVEVSKSIVKSLSLSLETSEVTFRNVPIKSFIKLCVGVERASSLFDEIVSPVGSGVPQNMRIELKMDRIRVFVSSVIWTSGSEADIVRGSQKRLNRIRTLILRLYGRPLLNNEVIRPVLGRGRILQCVDAVMCSIAKRRESTAGVMDYSSLRLFSSIERMGATFATLERIV